MSLQEIHERRLVANKILKGTFWAAKDLKHIHLTPEDLRKLNVQLGSLDLHGRRSGRAIRSGVQFFDPMPQRDMEALPDSTAKFQTPDPLDPSHMATTADVYVNFFEYLSWAVVGRDAKPLIEFGPWDKASRPEGLHRDGAHEYAYGRRGRYNWWWTGLWSTFDTTQPHQIIHTLHAMLPTAETDHAITRGELIPLIAFMVANMVLVEFKEHEVYPVLMLSFFATKARVLQAYFDGQRLQIHKSEFVDIGTETDFQRNKYDLTRWMLGKPAGNTKIRPSRK